MIKFADTAQIGTVKRTAEGYLVTQARAIRTGIQEYVAWEFGDVAIADGFDRDDIIRVYRPPESVFSKDSLRSAVHIPVTVDHPPVLVDSENWSEYAVGEVSTDVMRDGEYVAFGLMVKDKRGLDAISSGKVELSAGYSAEMVRVDHKDYDYVMGRPTFNHLAIVDAARAGRKARIGDSAHNWGATPLTVTDNEGKKLDIVKVMVGDKAVSVAASDADKFKAIMDAHAAEVAELKTQIADRDAAIGEKLGEITNLQAKQVTDADIERLAEARASVIDKASKIIDGFVSKGKTTDAIKREALSAVYDADAVKEFPSVAVDAMFSAIDAFRPKSDPVLNAVKDAKPVVKDNGQAAYEARLGEAWKGK